MAILANGFSTFARFWAFLCLRPEKFEYPINRFAMETKRQLDVLDKRLAEHKYVAGENYSIADIAIWPWYGALVKGWLYDAAEFYLSMNIKMLFVGLMKSMHAQRYSAAVLIAYKVTPHSKYANATIRVI